MRLSRLLLLPVAALGLAACGDDDGVTNNVRPPLGGVRFINAVPDGGPVDIRMIDQTAWSAGSASSATNTGLPYRAATIHFPTEAKPRHIRVFPTDSLLAVTSQILHDTTITIEPNRNVTLVLVGSRAPGGSLRFVMIDDTAPGLTGNQIAVRALNAGAGAPVSAYLTDSASVPLPATAAWADVAPLTPGAYVVRDTGRFAVRSVVAGTATPIASAEAPAGAPQSADGLTSATAGFRAAGSALAAYVFPRACPAVALPLTEANCPTLVGQSTGRRAALQASEVIFFIDRIPGPAVWTPAP